MLQVITTQNHEKLEDLRHCLVSRGKISHGVEVLDIEIPPTIQPGLVITEHIIPLAPWTSTLARFKQMAGKVVLSLTFPQPPFFLKGGKPNLEDVVYPGVNKASVLNYFEAF